MTLSQELQNVSLFILAAREAVSIKST